MNTKAYITNISLLAFTALTLFFSCSTSSQGPKELSEEKLRTNEILGYVFDPRDINEIIDDMHISHPTVYNVEKWLEIGPNKVDLVGWDDGTLLNYIDSFRPQFTEFNQLIINHFEAVYDVKYRIKELPSIIRKLIRINRGGTPHDISKLKDLGGVRIITRNLQDIPRIIEQIEENFEITRFTDKITNSDRGYRSFHLLVKYKDITVEIQIRTIGMHIWAEWSHDTLYKESRAIIDLLGKEALIEFLLYSERLSDYILSLEFGEPVEEPPPPEGIEVLWDLAPEYSREIMTPEGIPDLNLIPGYNLTKSLVPLIKPAQIQSEAQVQP